MTQAAVTEPALNASQAAALEAVARWLEAPRNVEAGCPVFKLHGYAGTGKTTLARRAAALAGNGTLFGAYTGKAAQVLRNKGCPARTVHSMLYIVVPKPRGRYQSLHDQLQQMKAAGAGHDETRDVRRQLSEEGEKLRAPGFALNPNSVIQTASLLVLDEVSMIGARMCDDLLGFRTPILALGDPAQLPPVRASDGYFVTGDPDVMLTEVVRQAQDSPVLKLATMARQGKTLPMGDHGDGTSVIPKGSLSISQLVDDFDQVLVGTNANRRALNRRIREHLGRKSVFPEPGDRLVCLKNDHDQGLLNGSQWIVKWARVESTEVVMELEPLDAGADVRSMAVVADPEYFRDPDYKGSPFSETNAFDYGYAMTTHKFQGSEADRVLVVDESYVFRQDRHRWLYTSITRASKSAVVSQ